MVNTKMRKLLACIIIIISSLAVTKSQSDPSTASETPTVAYCDIIRINVTYRFGFEWSEFYCLDCWDGEHRTWVDYADELCLKSKKIKDNGDIGRTVNVQVVGRFYSGDRYGDGGYQFKFVVSCVEKAKTISNDSPIPLQLPANVAAKARCKEKDSQR